jgi:hypothetical protein
VIAAFCALFLHHVDALKLFCAYAAVFVCELLFVPRLLSKKLLTLS